MFKLEALPYAHDALAPHISQETLEYHHDKHHQTYVDNLNKLIDEKFNKYKEKDLVDIVVQSFGKPDETAVFNNAAQHWNHNLYWQCMEKNGGGKKLPESLSKMIVSNFGSLDAFRDKFITEGLAQFGSGWVWLSLNNDKLEIMKTPNGENPLIHQQIPILGCDVWEHSYYIDYRNLRKKYIEAFFDNTINWEFCSDRLEKALSSSRDISSTVYIEDI